MIVGTEWLIEATSCNAESLRDTEILKGIFDCIIRDLDLKVVGDVVWHKFPGEGGVTGLALLTESHLACHTYPEHNLATFNLYCCRARPEWNWQENLCRILKAKNVLVRKIERGTIQNEAAANEVSIKAGGAR